jgi:Skp family chaperone for outer membrane proteins
MKKLAYSAFAIFAFLLLAASTGTARAQTCTAEDFGTVVDETARALRELNADGAKRYNAKLQEFQEKNNLSQDEIRQKAVELQDDRVGEFNREIEQLVNQMDDLSRTPAEQIDCGKLEELKQVRDRLLTVMGQKSGYMLANVDDALKTAPQAKTGVQRQTKGDRETVDPVAPETQSAEAQPQEQPQYLPENRQTALAPAPDIAPFEAPQTEAQATSEDPGLPERRPESANKTASAPPSTPPAAETSPQTDEDSEELALNTEPQSLQPPAGWDTSATDLDLPPPGPEDETFSIDEIRDAGRGVFGSITSEFAAAVNYAFGEFGRPNAYITGSEGGAAFLAGLRYGKGNLHVKNGDISTIYWQGPSLGYDVGAEGSSTLFLVYNLKDQERIYGRFTGVGGSAYVAGGFGLNVLGKGGMVMVPIRTGIGLRIGANLAYLKFTERQTWNPF